MTALFTTTARLRSLLLTTLVFSVLAIGCKKSDNSDPNPSSLAGNYKVTAYTATDGKTTFDYVALLTGFGSKCFTDLVISFNADGTVTGNNPASCNASGVDTSGGLVGTKWSVSSSTLTLTDATGKDDWTYSQSGSKLTLNQSVPGKDAAGNTVTVTSKMELTKQ